MMDVRGVITTINFIYIQVTVDINYDVNDVVKK